MTGDRLDEEKEPPSARGLFAAELRRLRLLHDVSQERLAALVVHTRASIASVEYGRQWPPWELAVRCDEVLHSGGTLQWLWPLVDAERRAARQVVAGVRLSDLRALVLRLAVLTGTDLSVLTVTGGEEAEHGMDREGRNDAAPPAFHSLVLHEGGNGDDGCRVRGSAGG